MSLIIIHKSIFSRLLIKDGEEGEKRTLIHCDLIVDLKYENIASLLLRILVLSRLKFNVFFKYLKFQISLNRYFENFLLFLIVKKRNNSTID
jgi:hypothetical protein